MSAEAMAKIDDVAINDVGLSLRQMMENAGRILAWHVRDLGGDRVCVVAGGGGNGGGGMVAARHLANHGHAVHVVLDRELTDLTGVPAKQASILMEMGMSMSSTLEPERCDVIVDALIGYGISGEVTEPAQGLIKTINTSGASVVSVDIPSGLDATTGESLGRAVDPGLTVTLALPKTGLSGREDSLYLADIGIPSTVYERLGITYESPFDREDWVKLTAID